MTSPPTASEPIHPLELAEAKLWIPRTGSSPSSIVIFLWLHHATASTELEESETAFSCMRSVPRPHGLDAATVTDLCHRTQMCPRTQAMGTKTIGLDDEAYAQLKAEKREGESFSDTVRRLTSEVAADWRHSLGKYRDQATEFEAAVSRSRETTSQGLAQRQREVNERLRGEDGTTDEGRSHE